MTTVLVVDDSLFDQQLAGVCIEQHGLKPTFAGHGLEALAQIERDPPDIVLTDLQMPEMDGLELVRAVGTRYPRIPVILMTAWGSEATAVQALRAGAASYVPKRELNRNLGEALRVVMAAVKATRQGERVGQFLQHSESSFILGYDSAGPPALIGYLRDGLAQLNFCDQGRLMQISTALIEALTNARDHGNLELDSALRESDDGRYRELGRQRTAELPYCNRRVYLTVRLSPSQAMYIIRDEGPGFDVSKLPDPTDPENLLRPSGRGVMLIRTFMDEVRFNDTGNEITLVKFR